MDPDAIFIILLYFILGILTITSITGLIKKTWQSGFSTGIKLCLIGLMFAFIVFTFLKFDSVVSGEHFFNVITLIIYIASFLISLNWALNISKKEYFSKFRAPRFIKISLLTIFFTILIPAVFWMMGQVFDELNLLGSNN